MSAGDRPPGSGSIGTSAPRVHVSVVISLFNGRAYVEQCVRSILAQTVRDLEVIVIDDGSTDGSPRVVEALSREDERVNLHSFERGGVSEARNRGLERARGDCVAFVDHDDLWYPQKLERQLLALQERRDAVGVGCLMHYISASGQRLGSSGHVADPIDQEAVRSARLTPFPTPSAVLFQVEVVRRVGGFASLFGEFPLTEDLHLYARIARHGELICVREVLGAYRVHGSSARSQASQQFAPAMEYTRRAIENSSFTKSVSWDEFRARYRPTDRERRDQLAEASYRNAGLAALERRWGPAARAIGRALLLRPGFTLTRAWRQLRGR